MSHFNAVTQKVKISDGNSSTVNLAGGATFTGSSASTLNCVGIQVNVSADQNLEILVEQSQDGTNWDIQDHWTFLYSLYSVNATTGGGSRTFQATASYFRVIVTNLSTSATTFLRVQSALCPMVEALPRNLDEDGSLRVGITSFSGYLGSEVEITPMGDMRVQSPTRLVGTIFSGTTLDTNFWTTSLAGAGSATLSGGEVSLSTGTPTANGSAQLNSIRTARYVAGNSNYFRAQVKCPAVSTTIGSNVRRWGAYNTTDGYFFELDGATGDLSVVCRKGSSDANKIATGSFNGSWGSEYAIDTNINTFEIYWTNKTAWFVVNDQVLHKFTGTTTTLVGTPSLPIRAETINSSGETAANTLSVRVASISRMGGLKTAPIYRNITGPLGATVLKYGPGCLHKIVINAPINGATVSVYDALTATNPIALITYPNGTSPGAFVYDLDFYTGLTVVTTGAAQNVTIVYE